MTLQDVEAALEAVNGRAFAHRTGNVGWCAQIQTPCGQHMSAGWGDAPMTSVCDAISNALESER